MKDNAEYMDNLDAEKLELIDKTKSFQNIIADQKDDLRAKDQEILALKKVISQMKKSEQNILDELEAKNYENKDLDDRIELNSKDNNEIFQEYERVISALKIEKDNLLKSLNALTNEIECT